VLLSRVGSVIIYPADGEPGDPAGRGFAFHEEGQYRVIDLPAGLYRVWVGHGSEVEVIECTDD
jgi:hypothetical protein